MTSIDTWSPWVAIFFLGGPMLLAALTLAYSLYCSHRYLDAIKDALKNSRYIYIWGASLGKRGVIWSILEMGKISGMMLWPKASIIIGELDPTDFEHFPPHLKRRLVLNLKIMITGFIWMLVGAALVAYR